MNKEEAQIKIFDRKYFTDISHYPKQILKGRKPFHNRFWIQYILKLKPKGRLLDLGCGEGFFLEYAEKHYESFGADISDYAINKAKVRCNKSKVFIKNATNLDFNINFDIITCFDMLEHLCEPILAIQEFSKLLNPKGVSIISIPNTASIGKVWKREQWHGYNDPTHVSLLSKKEWLELLRCSGLEIVEVFYDGLWDSPYFTKIPVLIQHFFFKFLSTLLFFLGFKFSERLGENLYIVSIKK